MRLLVVEDSRVHQEIARRLLSDLADVSVVASTLEAVDICQEFDLIILDIYTPTSNGWDAAHEFAQRCGKPALIWTADPGSAEGWPAVKKGEDELLRTWVKSYG